MEIRLVETRQLQAGPTNDLEWNSSYITFQGFEQGLGLRHWRQAGSSHADRCPSRSCRRRNIEQHFREALRNSARNEMIRGNAQNGLVDAEARDGQCLKPSCLGTGAHHDDLHWTENKPFERKAVTSGIESEVLDNTSEGTERVLRDLTILLSATQRLKA